MALRMSTSENRKKTALRLCTSENKEKTAKRMRNQRDEERDKANNEFECLDEFDKDTDVPIIKPNTIESFRKAQIYLHRTMVDDDRNTHKGLVCVVCEGQITGTNPVCYLSTDQINKHRKRLSVQSYNEYFGGDMDPALAKQYEVDEDDLSGLLLSPRSYRNKEGNFVACSHCHSSMTNKRNLKMKIHPNMQSQIVSPLGTFLKFLRLRC